jgi:hypothetical protein
MKIVHRVSLNSTIELRQEFLAAGINLRNRPELPAGLVWFDISESDPRWLEVAKLTEKHRGLDVAWTEFTPDEIETARAVELDRCWQRGYPQPENGFGYLAVTYDLTEYCESCGVGARQKAPFRIRGGEPPWRRRRMFQLNWVHDEYFVEQGLWDAVFRPLEVGSIPVLDASSKKALQTVVQLDVPARASAMLGGYPKERCQSCNRDKYLPIVRGPFPHVDIDSTGTHVLKTVEYFGSGHSAFQSVIISKELCAALRAADVNGVDFVPVASKT